MGCRFWGVHARRLSWKFFFPIMYIGLECFTLWSVWRTCSSLSIEPRLGSLADTTADLIRIELSQLENTDIVDAHVCHSISGPMCTEIGAVEHSSNSRMVLGSESLRIALGVPDELSLFVGSHDITKQKRSLSPPSGFRSMRIHKSLHLESFTARSLRFHGFSDNHQASYIGDWFLVNNTPCITPSGASVGMVFASPIVIEQLLLSPLTAASGSVFISGHFGGRELWRKEIRADGSESLLGCEVFAKNQNTEQMSRARILFDDGPLGLYVNWHDPLLPGRIRREDIITVIPGKVENLHGINEIRFVSAGNAVFALHSLVVTVGDSVGVDKRVQVVRAGGGLVFMGSISVGAVTFSGSEMVANKMRLINSQNTNRREFGQLVASLLIHPHGSVKPTQPLVNRASYRTVFLFFEFSALHSSQSPTELSPIQVILGHIDAATVTKFGTLNNIVFGLMDEGGLVQLGTLGYNFQFWVSQQSLLDHNGGRSLDLLIGKTFEGGLVCGNEPVYRLRLEVVRIILGSDGRGAIQIVEVKAVILSQGFAISESIFRGEYHVNFDMIFIPESSDWKYPMTLYPVRGADAESAITELIGAVERSRCNGVSLSSSSHGDIESDPNRHEEWTNHAKLAMNKFNSVLSQIPRQGS